MTHDLDLWLYGANTARVTEQRTGKMSLTFSEAAIERWGSESAVLSLSMPTRPARYPNSAVTPWIEGLLPEGHARTAVERTVGVRRGDTFGLLAEIGRESAGAAAFLPPGEPPVVQPMPTHDAVDLAAEIDRLEEHPLGVDDEARVSLAGMQDKLLLVARSDGRWAKPSGGAVSTHICKPENALFPGLVLNEAVCLHAARLLGLTTIDVSVESVAGRPVLIVSRYDRVVAPDGSVERIHQEDLCQALSISPEREEHKYEASGGPSLRTAARLLDRWSTDGEEQMRRLMGLAVFNAAVGNADAHGKNISLLHPPDGSTSLAPTYDIASTTQWRTVVTRAGERPVTRRMAMAIDGEYDIDRVSLGHFDRETNRWPLHGGGTLAAELLERFPAAVEAAGRRFGDPGELVDRLVGRANAMLAGGPAGDGDHLARP